MAFKLAWDQTGERLYETGVDRGVLYPINEENKYRLDWCDRVSFRCRGYRSVR